jgi:hypothetical protein
VAENGNAGHGVRHAVCAGHPSPIAGRTVDPRDRHRRRSDPADHVLPARLGDGTATFRRDAASGYLEAVLDALAVPVASQTLVFSKTSLQQARISPRNPRAIYFNDDIYVGYVRGGDVLEFAVGEPPLPGKVGTDSAFARGFAATGPADAHGRSLTSLDLETRLFAHPCSHLVYTKSFDGLPDELRARFWRRLSAALSEQGGDPAPHLSTGDRRAIREIRAATKPDAPADWTGP